MLRSLAHSATFSDRMDKNGVRNPINGNYEVAISGSLALDSRIARPLMTAAVDEIGIQFISLPPGKYNWTAIARVEDKDSSTPFVLGSLNWKETGATPDNELVQSGLHNLGRHISRILSPILQKDPSLRLSSSDLSISWVATENNANLDLGRASDSANLLSTVKGLLDRNEWFSPNVLVESVGRLAPACNQTLVELIEMLGPGGSYDKTTSERFAWLCKIALLPNIIDSGLLDPEKPWASRDRLLDEYLPLVELQQLLNKRIEERSAKFTSLQNTTIDCLISNEMDESRQPVAIHLDAGILAQKCLDRARTLKTLQVKYNLETFGDLLDGIKKGSIPTNILEVIIESDLFSFEYRQSMLEVCPDLKLVWNQASARLDHSLSENLADISFKIASL